jgi:hypothetical protein
VYAKAVFAAVTPGFERRKLLIEVMGRALLFLNNAANLLTKYFDLA